MKPKHGLIRKQFSIMKEEDLIITVKKIVDMKIMSKEDINAILEDLKRISFRFDIDSKPKEGMMNFNNIEVK